MVGVTALFLTVPAKADETLNITGELGVIDGDTFSIGPVQIRLYGIDAPEAGQDCASSDGSRWNCGRSATRFLSDLLEPGGVDCEPHTVDPYGRIVSICSIDGVDLSGEIIDAGMAWAFVDYSDRYVSREQVARLAEIGVFRAETQTAKEYRDDKWERAVRDSPGGCPIKGNISRNGRIYHTPWSSNYSQTSIDLDKGERWFCDEAEAILEGWVRRR